MQGIITAARKWALEEIEQQGSPPLPNFEIANRQGQILAEQFHLDKDIVMLGTLLMDIKLGECLNEGKIQEHVVRSAAAAEKFLEQYNVSAEIKEKILNCVAAHHATIPFICKEAEIVANADCYKFLTIYGWLYLFHVLGTRSNMKYDSALKYAEAKADEKWNALSLDICKKELEQDHRMIKEFCAKARVS